MLINFYSVGLSWGEALITNWAAAPGHHTPSKLLVHCVGIYLYKQNIKWHLFSLLKDYIKLHYKNGLEEGPVLLPRVEVWTEDTANTGLCNIPAHEYVHTSERVKTL